VLFFTFWQAFFIEVFQQNILNSLNIENPDEGAVFISTAESILVCIEMVLLSVITTCAFSFKDFQEAQKKNWLLGGDGLGTLAK